MKIFSKKAKPSKLFLALFLTIPTLALAAPGPLAPADIQTLSTETKGKSQVKINKSHGGARFVNIAPNQKGSLTSFKGATPKATADDFLTKHGKLFGITSIKDELKLLKSSQDNIGFTQVRYQQRYKGIPVYGADLVANVNKDGELRSVNGQFIPNLNINTSPKLTAAKAGEIAVNELKAEFDSNDSPPKGTMTIKETTLVIFDPSISEDRPGPSHLAYKVRVTSSSVAKDVFVDATTGFVLGKRDLHPQALSRRVYDAEQMDIGLFQPPKSYPQSPFWVEGNLFPTSEPFTLPASSWKSTNDALAATQLIYDLYKNTFGIDAPDRIGSKMDLIMNYTTGNAFAMTDFPGLFTGYGLDLATDDVVAHEWQHWYTHYTGGTSLDYYLQAGALNESYSDIFGEVIDFMNIGTEFGGGDLPNTPRTTGNCALISLNDPAARTATLTINSPSSIAAEIKEVAPSGFGNVIPLEGLSGDVVHVNDGSTAVVNPGQEAFASVMDACQAPFLTDVNGKIALIKRGNCNFNVKVANAESQGAIGVIVYNRDEELLTMGGSPPPTVTIPSLMITKTLGETIAATLLTNTVNVTMDADQEPRYTDNTLRWLNGEDIGVPPGANSVGGLRDLWDPTCLGYPGKVSDTQYYCGTGDNGGVHTNSSVPNHAFALLVDGGTFNGQNIGGLGLTKATHLYHRAQEAYQTTNMRFPDHADALEQACSDLTGQPLKVLASTALSNEVISNLDCNNVAKAMMAVEMRLDPACPVAVGFVSIAPVQMLEGNSGTKNMVFHVQLSAISELPVSMDYEVGAVSKMNPDSDAQHGTDYQPTKGTLVIPPGSVTGTITVTIKGDRVKERNENFGLRITNVQNATPTSSPYGVILNDD